MARAVTRLAPKIIPDKREKVLGKTALLEAYQAMGDAALPPGTVVVTAHGAFVTGDYDEDNTAG